MKLLNCFDCCFNPQTNNKFKISILTKWGNEVQPNFDNTSVPGLQICSHLFTQLINSTISIIYIYSNMDATSFN